MAYFIVEAPYDKCFDIFFKTELGYPNFYRMSELFPAHNEYQHLTLVAPYQTKEVTVLEKITEQVTKLGVKCLRFGEGLETAFSFDGQGQLNTQADFKAALDEAVALFLHNHTANPAQLSS